MKNTFDRLVDELNLAQSRRDFGASWVKSVTAHRQRHHHIDRSIGELGSFAKSLRVQAAADRAAERRAKLARLPALKNKATQLYKSGAITADQLCRFEAEFNRVTPGATFGGKR